VTIPAEVFQPEAAVTVFGSADVLGLPAMCNTLAGPAKGPYCKFQNSKWSSTWILTNSEGLYLRVERLPAGEKHQLTVVERWKASGKWPNGDGPYVGVELLDAEVIAKSKTRSGAWRIALR
jgi:hypothetical protein